MSDNGAETHGSNAPLRGRKRSVHEGGIRVPLVARFPGRIPAGTTSDEVGITMDLFATFTHLAGGALPANVMLDGQDVLPAWTGKARSPHADSPLFWAFMDQDAVRQGNWKLVRQKEKVVGLYDLSTDLGETRDLSSQNPERVQDLSRLLDAWRKVMRHPVAKG